MPPCQIAVQLSLRLPALVFAHARAHLSPCNDRQLRYLGEEGAATPLKAAVSMCNPFCLTISNAALQHGFSRIYDTNLANSLRRIYDKHALLWTGIPPPFRPEDVATAKTIRDFDDAIT